ncbi:RNA polymerase subunit sigma-24 [candidate division KSB1 bacterium 4484_188]|nr:MAG: RNA polymerase subunit sigma-24 [candidate division KSB1 bacterium 4484_188]HFE64987.1 sigma-70 family RNA polymerase sigma factor [Caldithrix sp.]
MEKERKEEDKRLIKSALQGDQKAYEALLNKYRNLVFTIMIKMVRNPQEAEDLTQEAFMKAFHSLTSFNEEFAFSTWLMKIATNNCIDFLRKRKLRTYSIHEPIQYKDEKIEVEIPDAEPGPEKNVLQRERKQMLEEAIARLPERYRYVIILRHKEEKSYEEISEILNLPLGTIKAQIFRAREILNKNLKELFK